MGYLGSPITSAAAVGMNAAQAKNAAAMQRMQAELSADNLEAKALRSELEAEQVEKLGRLEQAEETVKGRTERAEQKVRYAASGVSVDSASAVEVGADKAAWTEYRRQKIEYGAAVESWGLKYDAQLLRQEAHNTRAAGTGGASAGQLIVTAASQLSPLMFKSK